MTTLFGILFWDIIFAPVPGAFETPYQVAPLDIAEDTFYYSRQMIIEDRLDELKGGKAGEIVERICAEHAARGTWCVGVRWDLFQKEDLLQIVKVGRVYFIGTLRLIAGHVGQCLGGEALAVICRLLCEDYAARTSGVPDLIVWNQETYDCRFVEVKGPGDNLQENQKVSVLLDIVFLSG